MTNLLLLLLLLSCLSPPSMGFSRQEHRSRMPSPFPMTNLDSILKTRDITLLTNVHLVKAMVFPVVMYGREHQTIKKNESQSVSRSVVSNSLQHHDCGPPGSSVHGILQQEYQSGLSFPLPRDLSDPGTEPRCSALQADSLLSEPPGKPIAEG